MKKLVILIALALGVAGVTAGSAFAASGWTQVNVPSNGNNVTLLGASADTNTDAWAVGQQFVGAGQPPATAVAYHWTGTAWTLTPTPEPGPVRRPGRRQLEQPHRCMGGRVHDDPEVRLTGR